jgi:hypothetical protein
LAPTTSTIDFCSQETHPGNVRIASIVALLVLAVASSACHRTFSGKVTQPNPLYQPLETLRESERITIVTGDMDLELPRGLGDAQVSYGGTLLKNRKFPLQNRASFTVVSRDRLRFHVQIEHKWREYANVGTWKAALLDDRGRRYSPDDIDMISDRHVVFMWDYETRSVSRNRYGDIVNINDDGWKRRQPLGNLSLFRGRGDLVFFDRDLFTPQVKWLKLILYRDGLSFEFVWHFEDQARKSLVAKTISSSVASCAN